MNTLSSVRKKLGRRKMLTYAIGGATSLAVVDTLHPQESAKAATTNLTGHVAIGSWSVKATVISSTGSFPPLGTITWGVFAFTTDGLAIVSSSGPTSGVGVFQATSSSSISYSLVEQDFMSGSWDGNDNAHASYVNFAANGLSFTGSSEAWKFDTHANLLVKIGFSLQGTRITLTTPDKLPRQGS